MVKTCRDKNYVLTQGLHMECMKKIKKKKKKKRKTKARGEPRS